MVIRELATRVAQLQDVLAAYAKELQLALQYVGTDAASSLTKSRAVLERTLIAVYNREMGREPRKPLLGDILADNQFTRRLERRILSRMNAVRDMGNLGPHGEVVQPNDAARVLEDLCEILDWYARRYAGTAPTEPGDSEDRDEHNASDAIPPPSTGEVELPGHGLLALPPSLIEELSTSFELRRESLSNTQKQILFRIESLCRSRRFATQHEIAQAFRKAHDDPELYYRMEQLRLLGFLEKHRAEEGHFFLYTLSSVYARSSQSRRSTGGPPEGAATAGG
jgi:hypothetical protein